ncbi:MAG TPA: pyridoxal phosphate-dependent aminotransferase [Desulfomicrobiaceae bacterium]|nr:pyridoxal phosphate-dependent aminotransferase [Desulfomicrobiaceae bacterium]
MDLSDRVRSIKPSATLTINAKAQELRAKGRTIVSLAVGEPDFPTPDHVCQAAKQALDDGFTRYTAVPGIPELRQGVADYFKTFYGVTAATDNVMVSNGGKQCLYNLLQALVNPGDEVLVPAPYWVSYPAMVQLAGGTTVPVPTEPEDGFLVSVDGLEKHRTERTRVLILNTPSNPTGGHYPRADLDRIMEWAVANRVFVIADEIYDQLVYAPAESASVSPWWERHPDSVAVVNGLAKSFAMTGWRVGYVLAHADLIKAMCKIQGQSTSNICSMAQKGALAALKGSWDFLDGARKNFIRRRDLALEIVRSWDGVTCPTPDGAFYLFPRVDGCYSAEVPDSTALCARILEKAGVALVPGAAFGDDRCIRISYAVADEVLKEALEAIGKVLRELK